eukprot:9481780-Pyramimonas_sp.AAC.1
MRSHRPAGRAQLPLAEEPTPDRASRRAGQRESSGPAGSAAFPSGRRIRGPGGRRRGLLED